MVNYTINADGFNFSEDWDSINITVSRDGYDGSNYAVVAVSGSATPGVWDNQYKPSTIQALGGNGSSAIPLLG